MHLRELCFYISNVSADDVDVDDVDDDVDDDDDSSVGCIMLIRCCHCPLKSAHDRTFSSRR